MSAVDGRGVVVIVEGSVSQDVLKFCDNLFFTEQYNNQIMVKTRLDLTAYVNHLIAEALKEGVK